MADAYTYFIGADRGPVKIGRTTDLDRRLAELQSGSPVPLRVLGAVALDRLRRYDRGDPPTFEALCHRVLAEHRLHGEWFDGSAALSWWRCVLIDQTDYVVVDAWGAS